MTSTLGHLLAPYDLLQAKELTLPITGLSADSRTLKKGEVFLACPGETGDGRLHIEQAIARGAAAILYEPEGFSVPQETSIPFIPFSQLREQQGALASHWLDYPTRQLKVYGVTGTNGKTSCSHYIAQSLTLLGQSCGVMGTVGTGLFPRLTPSSLTTPSALCIQEMATHMVKERAQALSMEVSSHALVQGRVNGIHFNTAIFTNLTHDHLDFHHTFMAYGAAKKQLFDWPTLQHAIINVDDAFGHALFLELLPQQSIQVIAYSIQDDIKIPANAAVRASQISETMEGLSAYITTPWGVGWLQSRLLGRFNLSNLLAVFAALCVNEVPFARVLELAQQLSPVPGRMQCFGGKEQPLVVVDYAHTPDALKQVLTTLKAASPRQLWCVFGCGGDRDPAKRPLMGEVVSEYSDAMVITNDNPRTESPKKIVAGILPGISKNKAIEVQYDREKAIEFALTAAKAGDIVLIAGKGHEDYQIVGSQRFAFSDAEVVDQVLSRLYPSQ